MNRVIIATLLFILVLAANLAAQLGVSCLALLFSLLAFKEALSILDKQNIKISKILCLIFICLFHFLALIIPQAYEANFYFVVLGYLSLYKAFTVSFTLIKFTRKLRTNSETREEKEGKFENRHGFKKELGYSLALISYLGFAPSFYPLIRGLESGDLYLMVIIASVALNDTFALIGGKNFGLIPLTKTISPNKKIEGSLFGLLAGSVGFTFLILNFGHGLDPKLLSSLGWILREYFHIIDYKETFLNYLSIFILALLLAVIAQLGDLFESMIKRRAKVKDSGTILLSQGGILDRVDSHYFSIPFAYLVFYFFIR